MGKENAGQETVSCPALLPDWGAFTPRIPPVLYKLGNSTAGCWPAALYQYNRVPFRVTRH